VSQGIKVGDRVKMADADDATIPAYRDLIGTVLEVRGNYVRVKWDADGEPEFGARSANSVKVVRGG
jgi:hypothetical protein